MVSLSARLTLQMGQVGLSWGGGDRVRWRSKFMSSPYNQARRYLQPLVDTVNVVVMETRQNPQLLAVAVVAETDLTPAGQSAQRRVSVQVRGSFVFSVTNGELRDSLRVPAATAGSLKHLGGKPLDFPPTQLPGYHGALTLLELQQSLKDEQRGHGVTLV